jgi:hypothetical protein
MLNEQYTNKYEAHGIPLSLTPLHSFTALAASNTLVNPTKPNPFGLPVSSFLTIVTSFSEPI